MIVVGIIGILVSLTGSMYARFQAKSRQAEGKLALGTIYSLEKSFFSEYSAYIADFTAIGFAPEGSRRFYSTGWGAVSNAGAVTGYTASPGAFWYSRVNYPGSWNDCAGIDNPALGGWNTLPPAANTQNPQIFAVWAVGQVRLSTGCDIWRIDESKNLLNVNVGI